MIGVTVLQGVGMTAAYLTWLALVFAVLAGAARERAAADRAAWTETLNDMGLCSSCGARGPRWPDGEGTGELCDGCWETSFLDASTVDPRHPSRWRPEGGG